MTETFRRTSLMRFSTVRWTTTVAAAALMALPITASAQTPAPTTPPASQQQPTQQPPTPPPTTSPTQPPTSQPTTPPTEAQPPAGQADQAAAKEHLTAARESLSQLT